MKRALLITQSMMMFAACGGMDGEFQPVRAGGKANGAAFTYTLADMANGPITLSCANPLCGVAMSMDFAAEPVQASGRPTPEELQAVDPVTGLRWNFIVDRYGGGREGERVNERQVVPSRNVLDGVRSFGTIPLDERGGTVTIGTDPWVLPALKRLATGRGDEIEINVEFAWPTCTNPLVPCTENQLR